jgi:hypothetical protein
MPRVKITNVALVIRKAGKEVFRQSVNTKSGDALILPRVGDTMVFALQDAAIVEGQVDKMRYEYFFNGQQSLNEHVEIDLL